MTLCPADRNDSDTSTIKDNSFLQEEVDHFPEALLTAHSNIFDQNCFHRSDVFSNLIKTDSFADAPFTFEEPLKDDSRWSGADFFTSDGLSDPSSLFAMTAVTQLLPHQHLQSWALITFLKQAGVTSNCCI